MLKSAHERGFCPRYVCSDSAYSGLANLKAIRNYGWHWLMRFKSNRAVDPDDTGNCQIYLVNIPKEGRLVHLRNDRFQIRRHVAESAIHLNGRDGPITVCLHVG